MAAIPLFNLLRLHRALCAEPLALAEIIRRFGDADTFFAELSADWLREANFPASIVDALLCAPDRERRARIEADLRWIDHECHHLVTLWDSDYPDLLANIVDPPPLLFVQGDPAVLGNHQIAMVGSRKMTANGRRATMRIAGDLAAAGLTITSGLAIGIDGVAHQAALDANAPTIAVLACGCDQIYPPRHGRLAERILAVGAIVSELPLGTAPKPYHFPRRNRIVTGLSVGTIVVEAAIASGSLISARLAGEQGREVYAVPGSVFGGQSEGCHYLIKTGAKLIDSANDVLEELGLDVPPQDEPRSPTLDGKAGVVYAALRREPATIDELSRQLNIPVTDLVPILVELEIDGIVCGGADGYRVNHRDGSRPRA